MAKNILIAAGGTGGHLFPAMAVADDLIRQSGGEIKVHFIGTETRIESKKVPKAGFNYTSMPIKAFPGKNLKAVNWYLEFRKSQDIAKGVLKSQNIDALICAGAYLSVPPGYAARKLGIPIYLMESNVNLGKAHKMLLDDAENIFISWKESADELEENRNKAVLTGNPVRKEIITQIEKDTAKINLGFDKERPLILVIGGSLGAEAINNVVNKHISDFIKLDCSLLWQRGGSFEAKEQLGGDLPDYIKKVNFIDDMGSAYSAADIVISRSGATAVSEICAVGIASILVPLPSAANNEQMLNAKLLADNKAAILLPEKSLENNLMKVVNDLMTNPNGRNTISKNAKSLAKVNASRDISQYIISKL
ncbi:undecaprenyldiphospho-muramoylpentapeptide beta-N-acetylglucosaminyltransferase [Candidatus Kapabacteria bacterium]|nr:undecaprenyldiphospho-muramoylpentapeptide beta-N-acetylglucosaminyltransferase [Candidatus Kapabacteria bacterium]